MRSLSHVVVGTALFVSCAMVAAQYSYAGETTVDEATYEGLQAWRCLKTGYRDYISSISMSESSSNSDETALELAQRYAKTIEEAFPNGKGVLQALEKVSKEAVYIPKNGLVPAFPPEAEKQCFCDAVGDIVKGKAYIDYEFYRSDAISKQEKARFIVDLAYRMSRSEQGFTSSTILGDESRAQCKTLHSRHPESAKHD